MKLAKWPSINRGGGKNFIFSLGLISLIVFENKSLKPIPAAAGLSILGSRHLAFAARFFGTAIWHDDGDNSRRSFAAGMDEFTRSSGGFDGAPRPKLGARNYQRASGKSAAISRPPPY